MVQGRTRHDLTSGVAASQRLVIEVMADLGHPRSVGLGENASNLDAVVGLLGEGIGIPLAAGLVDKVAAVHVDRTGEARQRIVDRVDGASAEREHVSFAEFLAARSNDTARSSSKLGAPWQRQR
jgi:hypothetical protein